MRVPLFGPHLCHFEKTYLQILDKALDLFMEFKFCKSEFYFLHGSKNCMVATYNFGSVYMNYVFCIAYVFMSFTCGGYKEYYYYHSIKQAALFSEDLFK